MRPIFLPLSWESDKLFEEKMIEFEWHMGMSFSQKQKCVFSLHDKAKEIWIYPILEISSKSDARLWIELSAFNLKITTWNIKTCVESIFQGSKKFENGWPYTDLYTLDGRWAKTDPRLANSWNLIGFQLDGFNRPLEPKSLFYDWLYINALWENQELSKQLINYKWFSDIAFNPEKSFSCQARSAAIYVSLNERWLLPQLLKDKGKFIEILSQMYDFKKTTITKNMEQTSLFS